MFACLTPSGAVPRIFTTTVISLALAASVFAQPPSHAPGSRNYDARIEENQGRTFPELPDAAQAAAIEALRAHQPDLLTHYQPETGTVRTVYNAVGPLFDASGPYVDLYSAAHFAVEEHLAVLGLHSDDLDGQVLRDVVYDESGTVHLYLEQQHQGIPVYNGLLQVNMDGNRRVLSIHNDYAPGLARSARVIEPQRDASDALEAAAAHLGLTLSAPPTVLEIPQGAEQVTLLSAPELSTELVEARLAWLPVRRNVVRLVWVFQTFLPSGDDVFELTVDALTGKVWTRTSWIADASYKVYPRPVESPNHTSPLPPSDGRVVVTDPHLAATTASPNGWHNTGSVLYPYHRGNNVHAYDDRDANGLPPSSEPQCGSSLNCNFTLNLSNAPSTYTAAAVTNLFYWNNILHDVLYQYGFTEAAGNFQVNNFGRGGIGNDDVRAEAQDGSGLNNANFLTLPDGQRPRMQMYEWTAANPDRDSDLDNAIIVHEYVHGLSNRLVGGPTNVSCLGNLQQMGEGWSDWYALVFTAKSTDTATKTRGLGTYVLNQPTTGVGIRTQAYSTSNTVNNWTYQTLSSGVAVPHGVGAVWAQGLWEAYWSLVSQWGFDTNIYNATSGKGNTRALRYVTQGMKNTPCSPTFLQARDGIIQAAQVFNNGADVCRLWSAFAAFGMGSDATNGGPGTLTATNGFAIPTTCQTTPVMSVNITGPTSLFRGDPGTWNASVSGAVGTVTYKWYYKLASSSTWTAVGTNSSSYSRTAPLADFQLKVDVTTSTQSASDTHYVFVDSIITPCLRATVDGTENLPEEPCEEIP